MDDIKSDTDLATLIARAAAGLLATDWDAVMAELLPPDTFADPDPEDLPETV